MVWGSGLRVQDPPLKVYDLRYAIQRSGSLSSKPSTLKPQNLGFRNQGLGFGLQGLKFRGLGLESDVCSLWRRLGSKGRALDVGTLNPKPYTLAIQAVFWRPEKGYPFTSSKLQIPGQPFLD